MLRTQPLFLVENLVYLRIFSLHFHFECIGVLLACMSVQHPSAVPIDARRKHQKPGLGVTDSSEAPCRCWGLDPPEEQPAVFTTGPAL